ncbi:hypothetical protein BDV27DRAFT_119608 [Aspergillus caelatus]|uniref:Uncharacterized protein n=2 Tax=Aspergillus subgen. Circumdati TaxID=2720871 RepID=A0A5N7AMT1_9EURO|nr:uncharacterized protein BDV27DRAFT_119608 [Aspergillus caelatus]KAE8370299.1 hypothetical protein BDV27DRAFT_119608 [Aspergillus caelatus]KAE8423004.1 hypothetical protein BDV36DRAFT_244439 [Aspergillus pseudocaelatus]
MKFSVAAFASLLSVVSAAAVPSNNTALPAAFTLVADGGRTALTDGQYVYVGGDATDGKEILILRSAANGMVSFTSKDGVPTAFQNLYIVEKDVTPVSLTIPHSGAIPENGNMNGFGQNAQGYFTNNGRPWFSVDVGDAPSKQVYWYGGHNAEYYGLNLWVKECKGC